MDLMKWIRRTSPGSLVTAAFIGPGTITTCIKAGYTQAYSLLSVMITATILAIVIQYYAAKLGIVTQCGVGKNIQLTIKSKAGRFGACLCVFCALFVGNCAFEAGNITGAALGVQFLFGSSSITGYIICTSIIVGILLWNGRFSTIQKALKLVVLLMACCFLIAAVIVKPNLLRIVRGMFSLNFNGNVFLIGALVGTTIGPYNIFLHSEAAAQLWHSPKDIKDMMIDTVISIAIGGVISCCIIIVSAAAADMLELHDVTVSNFSKALEFPLGVIGQKVFLIGLFAAGISSAITAPLAAAYTIAGFWSKKEITTKNGLYRIIWAVILLFGLITSLLGGGSPANLILFAQYANAIILPLILIFLLYCLNGENMKEYKNRLCSNVIMCIAIFVCLLLTVKNFL